MQTDAEKLKKIEAEVDKLHRYINRYCTRAINIQDALGITGCKYLSNIIEITKE